MSETSISLGTGTQAPRSVEAQKVGLLKEQGERVTTSCSVETGNRLAVRAVDATAVVVVRVDTDLMARQKKNAEANASIRRRSRS
jgi:hypothetical protein